MKYSLNRSIELNFPCNFQQREAKNVSFAFIRVNFSIDVRKMGAAHIYYVKVLQFDHDDATF